MDSFEVFLRVRKEDIVFICPYFEAFAGLVAIRTPKPEAGDFATIKLLISPDFKEDFNQLLASLKRKLNFEITEPPQA